MNTDQMSNSASKQSDGSTDKAKSAQQEVSQDSDHVFLYKEKANDEDNQVAGIYNEGYIEILDQHPVERWTKPRMTIYLTCMIIYLVSTTNGYDGSLLSSLITLPEFVDHLNITSASGTGIVFAIFQVGQICITVLVWLGDYIGRKYTIFLGSLVVCIGAIITSVANNSGTFIGGRFLLSFGSGLAGSLSTSYLLEITMPQERSTLCSVYNTLYYVGSIIATWVSYSTSIRYKDSVLSFKIPLWLQLLCPGLVVLSILFFAPESPRYYYLKGQHGKARTFFVKYHANGQEDHPIVEYEMSQLELSLIEVPKLTIKDYFDFRVLFNNRKRAYRSGLVIAMSWFGQFSGNAVVGYYITTIFLDLGVKNATTRLLLNGINSILGYIFATTGSLLVGKLGRRFVLLYATSGFVISFTVIAACIAAFTNHGNQVAGRVGIAFVYIFNNVFFAFGYTPLQPLYPAEVLSSEMRARGMALFQLVQGTAGFINTYAAPVAMQNIKYWFYVFFVFWDLFQLIIIYYFFVETKSLTLEEIGLVFESSDPVKSSIIMSKADVNAKEEKKRLANLKLQVNFDA